MNIAPGTVFSDKCHRFSQFKKYPITPCPRLRSLDIIGLFEYDCLIYDAKNIWQALHNFQLLTIIVFV